MKLSFIFLILLMESCLSAKNRNHNVLSKKNLLLELESNWSYFDLKDTIDIKILHFSSKYSNCLQTFPNFIIGVTNLNDTIGLLDNTFDRTLPINEYARIIPDSSNLELKNSWKPSISYFDDSSDISLYRKVRKVYYGRIGGYNPFNAKLTKNNGWYDSPVWITSPDSITADLVVKFRLNKPSIPLIRILNFEGKTITSLRPSLDIGYSKITISTADMNAGMYMLRVTDSDLLNFARTFKKVRPLNGIR